MQGETVQALKAAKDDRSRATGITTARGLQARTERFNEARRVREAYDLVTSRLRAVSGSTMTGPEADRARRILPLSLEQAKKARADEEAAWMDLG